MPLIRNLHAASEVRATEQAGEHVRITARQGDDAFSNKSSTFVRMPAAARPAKRETRGAFV
ncbi:hypothetical protein [Caballeronia calidae]|uniref:hypothetical protein n=1 Tax=Caballeronia calidae TaxID=1777139 RepID=UPI000AF74868|nr:hypothetical protein [Caballeronia calidae]